MRLSPARDLHQNSGPSGAESLHRGRPLLLNSATEGGPGRPRMRRPPHSGSSRTRRGVRAALLFFSAAAGRSRSGRNLAALRGRPGVCHARGYLLRARRLFSSSFLCPGGTSDAQIRCAWDSQTVVVTPAQKKERF
ncbi:hypothetical protein NDU88_005604 [Pleurodeles waltl]|uniref:Uncharacterized protein n=1 Tax=Pleurodeles waltl TaxID=8319 RepID=A0AAV7NPH1_PLEWA|nr:hypothetical protein NDU88_005604 [Pleurodeles waltl]